MKTDFKKILNKKSIKFTDVNLSLKDFNIIKSSGIETIKSSNIADKILYILIDRKRNILLIENTIYFKLSLRSLNVYLSKSEILNSDLILFNDFVLQKIISLDNIDNTNEYFIKDKFLYKKLKNKYLHHLNLPQMSFINSNNDIFCKNECIIKNIENLNKIIFNSYLFNLNIKTYIKYLYSDINNNLFISIEENDFNYIYYMFLKVNIKIEFFINDNKYFLKIPTYKFKFKKLKKFYIIIELLKENENLDKKNELHLLKTKNKLLKKITLNFDFDFMN